MVKDESSFRAQVGMKTVLYNKIRLFLLFLSFAISIQYSAQEQNPQKNNASETTITVIGDAVIYSDDQTFNSQIKKSDDPSLDYSIVDSDNNALKITAKRAEQKTKSEKLSAKKEENIVISTKKEKDHQYHSKLQKKDVTVKIRSKDPSGKFISDPSTTLVYFLAPGSDSSLSKAFVGYHLFQDQVSVKFPDTINYYYQNKNLRQQICIYKLSVRPPPRSIL